MPPPVLLIHGCGSTWQAWRSAWVGTAHMVSSGRTPGGSSWHLYEAGPGARPARAHVYLLDYSGATTQVSDLSWTVAGAIGEIRRLLRVDHVVLIAHSLGGLVARGYVQQLGATSQYQNDVAALYTLATPNNGARVVGMVGSLVTSLLCPQSWSVHPLAQVIHHLNQQPMPSGLHCATVTGMGCRIRWFGYHDGVLFADDTYLQTPPANGFVASWAADMQHSVQGNPFCSGHSGVIPASVTPIEQLYDSQFP